MEADAGNSLVGNTELAEATAIKARFWRCGGEVVVVDGAVVDAVGGAVVVVGGGVVVVLLRRDRCRPAGCSIKRPVVRSTTMNSGNVAGGRRGGGAPARGGDATARSSAARFRPWGERPDRSVMEIMLLHPIPDDGGARRRPSTGWSPARAGATTTCPGCSGACGPIATGSS